MGIFLAFFMLIWAHHVTEERHLIVPEVAYEVFEGCSLFRFVRHNQVSLVNFLMASSTSGVRSIDRQVFTETIVCGKRIRIDQ